MSVPPASVQGKEAYLLPVEQHRPMDHQSPSLVYTRCEACSEDEHVYSPLDLREHQAADGSQTLLVLLFEPLGLLRRCILTLCPLIQRRRARVRRLSSDIRECLWQVPPLEYRLLDIVTVVSAKEGFGGPSLLEQGRSVLLIGEVY